MICSPEDPLSLHMEMDPGAEFEPQTRARSNTWPLPQCDPSDVSATSSAVGGKQNVQVTQIAAASPSGASVPTAKKNSSRRNAWGNLSYADLITQAIGSSPDKRLTLSQIYEWMVHNVAYFKDKGDSNSSAGWKNSIRHNLSLHNRFVRMQNEGTGKSSWWMLNPDAKPGKSARRRAASMETSKFEKRRGRVKKKVEAMRSSAAGDPAPSPSSSVSESLDLFPESPHLGYQLSPEFRPRASSNASSSGGRLSPIAASESEWVTYYGAEQLAGSLEATMRLGQDHAMRLGAEASGFAYPPPPPPPPPYRPPPYPHCPLHRQLQPCQSCSIISSKHSPPSLYVGGRDGEGGASTMMGQLIGVLNRGPEPCSGQGATVIDDVNLNIETLPIHGGFDCNVDEVIKHELSLDGNLEFNFTQQQPQEQPPAPPFSTGHPWVH